MVIGTKTFFSGKRKIWMKFVSNKGVEERTFNVSFIGIQNGEFFYEVDNSFPEEMIKLIFGHKASIKRA